MAHLPLNIMEFPKEILELIFDNKFSGFDFRAACNTCTLFYEIIESNSWSFNIGSGKFSINRKNESNGIIYNGKKTNNCPGTVIIPSIDNKNFNNLSTTCPFIINILKKQILLLYSFDFVGNYMVTTDIEIINPKGFKIHGPEYPGVDINGNNLAGVICNLQYKTLKYQIDYHIFQKIKLNPVCKSVIKKHKIRIIYAGFSNQYMVTNDTIDKKKHIGSLSYYGSEHPNIKKQNRITFYRKEYHNFSPDFSEMYCTQHNIPHPKFPKFIYNLNGLSIELYTKYTVTEDFITFVNGLMSKKGGKIINDFSFDQVADIFMKSSDVFFSYFEGNKVKGSIMKSYHQKNPYGVYVEPKEEEKSNDDGWISPLNKKQRAIENKKIKQTKQIPPKKEYKFIKQGSYFELVRTLYNDKVRSKK